MKLDKINRVALDHKIIIPINIVLYYSHIITDRKMSRLIQAYLCQAVQSMLRSCVRRRIHKSYESTNRRYVDDATPSFVWTCKYA